MSLAGRLISLTSSSRIFPSLLLALGLSLLTPPLLALAQGDFTDIGAGLTGVDCSSVAWGDYDNDGDLDILLTGDDGSNIVSFIYRNDAGFFTDIGAGLVAVHKSSVAWGDYDNDGDLDILLTGNDDVGFVSRIYRNDAGLFTDIGAGLTGVDYSSVAWGDYDNDGDLDILLAGHSSSGFVSLIYRNDAGLFTDIGAGLTGIFRSSVAWGDYDNDGDLDILLTGSDPGFNPLSRIYCNNDGIFTDIGAGLVDAHFSSVAWSDYDNDGDLDILLTGEDGSDPISLIYRNNAPVANTAPSAPSNLSVEIVDSAVHLEWDSASDAQTPSPGLTYNVRIGTTPGGSEISSPHALASGLRTVPAMGNANHNTTWSFDLPLGDYYWSVQALDGCFAGSAFATEDIFIFYEDFTDIDAGLTGVYNSSVAWGDYDNDGDLDILLTGDDGSTKISRIYRNDGGLFTDIVAGLTGVYDSSVAWGDYDNDGDLDILLTGYADSGFVSRIYRNDGGLFTDIVAGLTGIFRSSVAWGDYDNDGDLDILLTGHDGSGVVTLIYRNDAGIFTDIGAGLTGVYRSSIAWGDYDNDGDLDILLAGYDPGGDDLLSLIYRNNAPVANTAPSAPSNLSVEIVDSAVHLEWDSASDAQTPSPGLTYNVRIGTIPGASDICPPMALGSGYRLIPSLGNANHNTDWPFDLPLGNYYWSVQALDTSFEGSPFAAEAFWCASGSFTSIEDVGNDQGRYVRLTWERSPFDTPGDGFDITGYQIYRRLDGRLDGWDGLDWVPAYGDEIYNYVAPTLCDSTAEGGICWSTFMIRATTPDPFTFADSPPDSGYSVDNLAPSVPDGFEFGTETMLVWEASGDEDFDYFTVYGSASEVFDESAVLIDYTIGTEMDVTGQGYSYYHLTATDFAGNESDAATVFDATDAPPGIPERFALHAPSPNPFNPRTFLRFDLPEAATVSLKVYDLSGRLIRTLVEGERREAGRYEEAWNGRDDRGRAMASGIYLCRIETDTFSDAKRMTLLK